MNQIAGNEPNKWRLEPPGSAGWRPSPRPGRGAQELHDVGRLPRQRRTSGPSARNGRGRTGAQKAGADPKLPRGDRLSMLSVSGIDLDIVERGRGRPLLFLHAGEGLSPDRPWLDRLAQHFRVIAPVHPGWGLLGAAGLDVGASTTSPISISISSKQLDLKDTVLVGNCFGGWIAAEMAVRDTRAFREAGARGAAGGVKIRAASMTATLLTCTAWHAPRWSSLLGPIPSLRRHRLYENAGGLSSPASCEGARRSRCSAGSHTCTIPSSSAGCIVSTCPLCCCGASGDRIITPGNRRTVAQCCRRRVARDYC